MRRAGWRTHPPRSSAPSIFEGRPSHDGRSLRDLKLVSILAPQGAIFSVIAESYRQIWHSFLAVRTTFVLLSSRSLFEAIYGKSLQSASWPWKRVNKTTEEAAAAAGASLARSAGFTELDQEVIALVHRASPVPAPPAGAQRTITAPVRFNSR